MRFLVNQVLVITIVNQLLAITIVNQVLAITTVNQVLAITIVNRSEHYISSISVACLLFLSDNRINKINWFAPVSSL
jgi:hypothetical protein